MPFVKLDCGILNSSLWVDHDARTVFITALLMAEPFELRGPIRQMATRSLDFLDFHVPAGWYGLVPAASVGIVQRAGIEREAGLAALERLASPDPESRSEEHEGRRLVRVNGGFLVLNYDRYRQRDYTAAERQRRHRDKQGASRRDITDETRDMASNAGSVTAGTRYVTQAEAEVEAEAEETGKVVDQAKGPRQSATPPFEVAMSFPCQGFPSTFDLGFPQIDEWQGQFPGLNVEQECRTALAWCNAQPARRKTAKGMPRFLVSWLSRSVDRSRGPATAPGNGYRGSGRAPSDFGPKDPETVEALRKRRDQRKAESEAK